VPNPESPPHEDAHVYGGSPCFGAATSSAALGGRRDTLSAPIACVLLTPISAVNCGPQLRCIIPLRTGNCSPELGNPSVPHGFPSRILGVTPDIQAGSVTSHWVDLFTLFGKQALNASGGCHEKRQAIAVPVDNLNHSWFGAVRLTLAIGVAYFLAARLGLALLAQVGVAIFWPAAGIATGVLIALGPAARLPVTVAVAVASMASGLLISRNVWLVIIFAFLNVGEVLLTAWLVARWFAGVFKLEDVPQVLGFLVASAIAAGMGATGAAIAVTFFESFSPDVLAIWFVAGLLGTVTVAPLLIGLREAAREPPPRPELLEGTIALTTLAAVSIFVISLPQRPWATVLPVAFVFSLLLWIAVRCRPVFTAAAMFVVALAVVWSITFNIGHFGDASIPLADRMLAAQTLLLVGTLLALVLAALFAERRRNEATLEMSNERLQRASEREAQFALAGKMGRIGRFTFDIGSGAMQVSSGYAAIHGLPEGTSETTRADWRTRVHPDDLARLDANLQRDVEARRSEHDCEYRIICLTGETRWIEARSFISYDREGTALSVIGVNIDVTERKKAELALADLNLQLALAGKVGRVGSYAYAALHGLPEGTTETSLCEWRARVHPADLGRVERVHDQAVADRRRDYGVEYRIVLLDGEVRWTERRCLISYNGDSRPQRVVGVVIDITERKQAERQRNTLNAELDHRVKNVLATVGAIIFQTQHTNATIADFVASVDRRIKSLASTHELLSHTRWQGVSLLEIIRREFAPYSTGNTDISGPSITLRPEAAQAVAMVLHELTTNAAKYGALSNRTGRVSVRWFWPQNGIPYQRLSIDWRETDGPPVSAPSASGYGTSIIRELIPFELGGNAELVFAAEGIRCRLEVPARWISRGGGVVAREPAALRETG
jgi:PAS domain S-box-containing protein